MWAPTTREYQLVRAAIILPADKRSPWLVNHRVARAGSNMLLYALTMLQCSEDYHKTLAQYMCV
jgi:hypothetical protein